MRFTIVWLPVAIIATLAAAAILHHTLEVPAMRGRQGFFVKRRMVL